MPEESYIPSMRHIFLWFNLSACLLMRHYCKAQADTLVAYPGGDAVLTDFIKSRLVTTRAAQAAKIGGDVILPPGNILFRR